MEYDGLTEDDRFSNIKDRYSYKFMVGTDTVWAEVICYYSNARSLRFLIDPDNVSQPTECNYYNYCRIVIGKLGKFGFDLIEGLKEQPDPQHVIDLIIYDAIRTPAPHEIPGNWDNYY